MVYMAMDSLGGSGLALGLIVCSIADVHARVTLYCNSAVIAC